MAAPAAGFSGFTATDAPSFDVLNTCVQCGLCLPTCPTYRETYREQSSPRGRLHLMRAVHEQRIDVLDPVFTDQMSECLDCRACEAACPSGVAYGPQLEAARAQIAGAAQQRGQHGIGGRLARRLVFGYLFQDLGRLRRLSALARFYQRSGGRTLARRTRLLDALGLDRLEAMLPLLRGRPLVPAGQTYPAQQPRRGRVALLAGCVMHVAYAHVHEATIRVLQRNGWEVVVPAEQGCCGALHVHGGDPEGGRALARRNIAALLSDDVDVIVSDAAGCGAALKNYGHLLAADHEWQVRAAGLAAKTKDVLELLAEQPLRGPLGKLRVRVTYQEPCHLAHAQRISAQPRALLRQIPGLELVEMAEPAMCCGAAGLYGVSEPEMSARLLTRKLANALTTTPRIIATANPGCAMQLQSGLQANGDHPHVQVRHVIELLDAAYRHG